MNQNFVQKMRAVLQRAGVPEGEIIPDPERGLRLTPQGDRVFFAWLDKLTVEQREDLKSEVTKVARAARLRVVAGTAVTPPHPKQAVGCGAPDLLTHTSALVCDLLTERSRISRAGDDAAQAAASLAFVKGLPDRLAPLVTAHERLSTALLRGCRGAPVITPTPPGAA